MRRKELFEKTIDWFKQNMPVAVTELHYVNSYQLLVSVILSAQCTDKRVNLITPAFFKRFPDPKSLSLSTVDEIFDYIKSCSYPNNKARNLWGMSNVLINEYAGVVPNDRDQLQKLSGVGRKTANVILSVAFNKPALAVDTHVFRVASRIGLSVNAKTPLETEKQLVKYIPENLLNIAHHWLILHGRYICLARKPKCLECGLKDVCKYFVKTYTPPFKGL
jgi:endonuclease III